MENQEQTQTPSQPDLSIADLQNIRVLIDVAVRRGAYPAAEFSSVGAVYDKLNAFLNFVAEQAQQAKAAEEANKTMGEPEISAQQ